jgi:hypothetical protein
MLLLATAGVCAVVLFVLVWFQPQKLWIDDRVTEALPTASTTSPTASGTSSEPAGPMELSRGTLVSLDHHTEGVVRILTLEDGQRVARLENLDTSNGPDLYVYLTANKAAGPEDKFDDEYVSLGRLKGNQGDQNYELPDGVDTERFSTLVIWCDRFNSAFGAADLSG